MRRAAFAQGLLLIAGGKPIGPRLIGTFDQGETGLRHLFQRLADVIGNVRRHAKLGPRCHDAGQGGQVAVGRHVVQGFLVQVIGIEEGLQAVQLLSEGHRGLP